MQAVSEERAAARPVEAPEIRAAMPAGPGLAVRSRPGPIVPFLAASDAIALVAAFIVTSLAIPTMSGRAGVHVEGLVLFAIALPGWFAAARLYGLYASEPGRELLGRGGEWTSVGRLMVAGTWLLLAIAWLAGLGQPATARLVVFAAVAVAFVVSAPATSASSSPASCCTIRSTGSTWSGSWTSRRSASAATSPVSPSSA
jgi:hypothetical protein